MDRIRLCVSDFFHLANDEFEFLVAGVKMRRDAHAGAGTIIDDELATNQLARDCARVVVSARTAAATANRPPTRKAAW